MEARASMDPMSANRMDNEMVTRIASPGVRRRGSNRDRKAGSSPSRLMP
ncbi:Uncharacterised protein [Mycobacteroides abscessus subsp. abscessus]|nr:Uncharacterised protein [Mycobacteroides abscessus subsp. abscessus]